MCSAGGSSATLRTTFGGVWMTTCGIAGAAPVPSPTVGTGSGSGKTRGGVGARTRGAAPFPRPTVGAGSESGKTTLRRQDGCGVQRGRFFDYAQNDSWEGLDVDMRVCRRRAPPLGAHKRRPYEWLSNRNLADYETAPRWLPRPTVGTGSGSGKTRDGVGAHTRGAAPRPAPAVGTGSGSGKTRDGVGTRTGGCRRACQAAVFAFWTPNVAPCGSIRTARRRPGHGSIGSAKAIPPRVLAFSTVASQSATAK